MAGKRDKRIVIQVTPEEQTKIKEMAQKANMDISKYVRTVALRDEQVKVVDRSTEIIGHLGGICTGIEELERKHPIIKNDLTDIQKEVMGLWHTLKS